jgi:hypothetical protein
MSFIDKALDDAVEKEVVPDGEYDLIIENAEVVRKNNKERISVRLKVDGEPNAKTVFHNISLIDVEDDEEKANNKLLFGKAFIEAFNIPIERGIPFNEAVKDIEAYYGCRGRVRLTQREYEGVLSNQIKLSI